MEQPTLAAAFTAAAASDNAKTKPKNADHQEPISSCLACFINPALSCLRCFNAQTPIAIDRRPTLAVRAATVKASRLTIQRGHV